MGLRWIISGGLALLPLALLAHPVKVGELAAPALKEASGLVQSRKHPGVFWTINDSGNAPELFAIRKDGRLIRSYKVDAPNIDWEDIAIDNRGFLYIGDIGNNTLKLPTRAIYKVVEPDPEVATDKPIKPVESIHYRYPADRVFDAESLVVVGDQALLIDKKRNNDVAMLYRLPLDPPAPLIRPATPDYVGIMKGCTEPAQGASLTADGRRLAVVTDRSVHVFEYDGFDGFNPIGECRFDLKDVEGIAWDGFDLLLVSENRSLYRLAEADWRSQRGGGK